MEEEKKEVVQAEEQPKQEGGMTPNSKNALAAFIASVVGVCFSAGCVSLPGVTVCSAGALSGLPSFGIDFSFELLNCC